MLGSYSAWRQYTVTEESVRERQRREGRQRFHYVIILWTTLHLISCIHITLSRELCCSNYQASCMTWKSSTLINSSKQLSQNKKITKSTAHATNLVTNPFLLSVPCTTHYLNTQMFVIDSPFKTTSYILLLPSSLIHQSGLIHSSFLTWIK